MKIDMKDYVALKDVLDGWIDLEKARDPNDPIANDPILIKKNEEAQRRLKNSNWPKDVFKKTKQLLAES